MGCDIHSYAERKAGDKYEFIADQKFADGYSTPFDWRAYGMFAFLAGVRNYSDLTPIAEQRGWPADASAAAQEDFETWGPDAHSPSWLSVEELAAFDYEQPMEDRRVMRGGNGGCTAKAGGGQMTTFREFLGEQFFEDLAKLKDAGADRVVFFFDN